MTDDLWDLRTKEGLRSRVSQAAPSPDTTERTSQATGHGCLMPSDRIKTTALSLINPVGVGPDEPSALRGKFRIAPLTAGISPTDKPFDHTRLE